jgi:Flp pilus assembly protein TadG
MTRKARSAWRKLRECDGAVLVESAIGLGVLVLFILGIIEFGFLWYQKQVVTNASREGARYGVTYQTTSSGSRLAPKNFNPTIQTVVGNYLSGRIPTGSYQITVVDNTGYETGVKGEDLVVQVSCLNQMDLLSGFIPQLANINFSAQTIMKCE